MGLWTVNIHQEGHSQRSAPQKRYMAHLRRHACCTTRKLSGWDWGGNKSQLSTGGDCAHQAPGHLSCSDLGQAQKAGPTKSAPLWSTREPEPEQLRPGKNTQPRARFGQFPFRATWSLSSVERESIGTVSWGKPSVVHTLGAHPTHPSDICLQCRPLPATQLNK